MNKATVYRTLAQSLASCPEITDDAALEIAECFVLGIEGQSLTSDAAMLRIANTDAIVDAFRTFRRAKVWAPIG